MLGRPLQPVTSYRTGVHLWAPTEDLRAFVAARRSGQTTSLGWLRSLLHRQHLAAFDRTDPGPALASLRRRLRRLVPGRRA
jgi:hypothetical protein